MEVATGGKWFMIILFYFVVLITLVTAIENLTSETIGDMNEHTSDYCSLPRTTYEQYPDAIIISDTTNENYDVNFWFGNLECQYSKGIVAEDICLQLEGCSWEASTFLWWETGTPTCKGSFNYSQINASDISNWFEGNVIDYTLVDWDGETEDSNNICSYPSVITNETLCSALSCSWANHKDLNEINPNDVKPNASFIKNAWDLTIDIFTFNFDFGFTNDSINNLLIIILFILPLFALGFSIYMMIPFI